MNNDIIATMEAEEAELSRKLEAVRHFLAAYRGGDEPVAAKAERPSVARKGRQARSAEERMDKFGAYGQRIVDWVVELLPRNGGNPVTTRTLVSQLEALGVEITGNNKVNSLSALLARSSKINGYGRAGWTLQSDIDGSMYPDLVGSRQKENGEAEAPPETAEVGASVVENANPLSGLGV